MHVVHLVVMSSNYVTEGNPKCRKAKERARNRPGKSQSCRARKSSVVDTSAASTVMITCEEHRKHAGMQSGARFRKLRPIWFRVSHNLATRRQKAFARQGRSYMIIEHPGDRAGRTSRGRGRCAPATSRSRPKRCRVSRICYCRYTVANPA